MSYEISAVVAIALAETGYLEKRTGDLAYLYNKTANTGNANYTKYGYEMHKLYPSVMDYPAAWCDAYVDWCFYKAYGVATAKSLLGGNFDDYTVASAQMYKDKGGWHKAGEVPQVGDQVFFKNSVRICHTGLIVEVDLPRRVFRASEGNTSNLTSKVVPNGGAVCVKEYSFDNSAIAGYGRPNYGPQKAASAVVSSPASAKVEAAASFSAGTAGTYYARTALNLRTGAGKTKPILAVIPENGVVRNYGYYTVKDGVKWLLVKYGNVTGFASGNYLRKR